MEIGQVMPSYVLNFGTLVSSVRNQSSFLPLVHFTEEKGWISVTSVIVCDDYPGYENVLSWVSKFFRLYVKI